jgi:hypothetical protein
MGDRQVKPLSHLRRDTERQHAPTGAKGATGQGANPTALLDRLLEALMEPVGREARQRAAEAIQAAAA